MTSGEKTAISGEAIGGAVEKLLAASKNGKFTRAALLRELGGGRSQSLASRVDTWLEADGRFFADGGEYILKSVFFKGFRFVITPDDWEIANGILLPGHRFCAYLNGDVFPSEVKLIARQGGHAVATREITAPLPQVFHYHMLLGSEQVFDFMIADSAANAGLRYKADSASQVTLHVFDLAKFYRDCQFQPGDALACEVADFDKGEVVFDYLTGSERVASAVRKGVVALEAGLKKTVDRFDNYLEMPEQLAYSCFYADAASAAAASLDEFSRLTERFEIAFDSGHSALAERAAEPAGEEPATLPEGISLSRGETGEIAAMLREVGSPLTPAEVDGFAIDQAYARELDFEEFFARAFGREKLHFTDEAQQAAFYNYVEDRFEELTENYDRIDDELKAPLRSVIMELVDDKLAFFDLLTAMGEKVSQLPHDDFHRLAEVSMQLNEILKQLDDPHFEPVQDEIDRLTALVEERADDQDELIARLSGKADPEEENTKEDQ
ncbi:MAG: hypothetical protein PHI35_01495 [Victivallaceae bacterium]|nr:hypothetical protein [Victivallaceae bacterium]